MDEARLTITPRAVAFASALLTAASNGIVYSYSMYSSRAAQALSISLSQVVVLGVLIQTGMGAMQYPVTLCLSAASVRGVSQAGLDSSLSVLSGILFFTATLGLGLLMQGSEHGSTAANAYGIACMLMFMWGWGVGSSFLHAAATTNHNFQDDIHLMRRAVAAISLSVGIGAVISVVVYKFILAQWALSTTFFCFCGYLAVSFIRCWGARVA